MFSTPDPFLAAEIAYRRERITASWSNEPIWRRIRRHRPPEPTRPGGGGHHVAWSGPDGKVTTAGTYITTTCGVGKSHRTTGRAVSWDAGPPAVDALGDQATDDQADAEDRRGRRDQQDPLRPHGAGCGWDNRGYAVRPAPR